MNLTLSICLFFLFKLFLDLFPQPFMESSLLPFPICGLQQGNVVSTPCQSLRRDSPYPPASSANPSSAWGADSSGETEPGNRQASCTLCWNALGMPVLLAEYELGSSQGEQARWRSEPGSTAKRGIAANWKAVSVTDSAEVETCCYKGSESFRKRELPQNILENNVGS